MPNKTLHIANRKGSKNIMKDNESFMINVLTAEQIKSVNESEFLTEVLAGLKKWKAKGEKEYAEAYRVLLNKFTQVDIPGGE